MGSGSWGTPRMAPLGPISTLTPGWCRLRSGKGSGTLRKSQDTRITSFQGHPTAQRVSCHPHQAAAGEPRAAWSHPECWEGAEQRENPSAQFWATPNPP